MATVDEWIAHAETLPAVAMTVFEAAGNVPVTEREFYDPKVLSLALLSRSYNTFRAILALARQDFVPEMRTLVRSCYENLFLVVGLAEKGDGFIEEMLRDEQMAQIGTTKVLWQVHRAEVGDNDPLVKQLKSRIDWMKDHTPKPAFLNPGDAVANTSIEHTYLVYRNLSRDSAHPSITALKRHLDIEEVKGKLLMGLDVQPLPKEAERIETIDLACIALMALCMGVAGVLGVESSAEMIDAAQRYDRLKYGPEGFIDARPGCS
ncbi:DUF5677 domain-containing protein [Lichenihabitans psoromatis]|uniref:DUF5677 domain-containing protein n=1 Tax=Lichenihabitans psoromatis TaxID=2528642 RepID=UPI0010359CC5|nr:DUF5677 domain-containing protein [Lichenihabitans psoromatis]